LGDPRLAVTRREFGSLSREKTIVLALLIQLFVAAFSSFLVVGLTSLYDPGSVAGQVEVGVSGDAADEFLAAAAATEGVGVARYDDDATLERAFERGAVDAAVSARHSGGRVSVTATVPENSLGKTLVVTKLREALEELERRERLERAAYTDARLVSPPPRLDTSPYFAFSYTVLLPLLLFLPVFISGSLAVDAVTEERERGTLDLLRVTPLTLTDIVEGKALAAVALAPLQAALWLVLLSANGIAVANPVPLLVLTTGLALVFVALGVGFALGLRDRQRAQLGYSLAILGAFTAAAFLPEHPATTAALLAVDSATATTFGLVVLYAVLGVALAVAVRGWVGRLDPERL
jgi:ABC-2 type transport system permease protein